MLKIDDHPYSPTLVHRITLLGGLIDSAEAAALALQAAGEIEIASRTVQKLVTQVGQQLTAERDRQAEQYVQQPLPRVATSSSPPIDLAAIFLDGGRIRTRTPDCGPGVHQPHWRETKNAGFHRMQSSSHAADPQPELPDCFCNQAYVQKLVLGLKKAKQPQQELIDRNQDQPAQPTLSEQPESPAWQPQTLVRTCLSSLADSDAFGPLMAAEADARGFFAATKRAFLGDGQAYNWTIQRSWFPTFTPIVDFVHVVEYLYEAAQAVHQDVASRWQQYVNWASACWQGRAEQVLDDLARSMATADAETAERLRTTHTYLSNNRARMNYAQYRREGLPMTSSLAESLVKQVSKRVKGTEKFWNHGPSGEAILQIRAAVLSQDGRLATWIRTRPISCYASCCRQAPSIAT